MYDKSEFKYIIFLCFLLDYFIFIISFRFFYCVIGFRICYCISIWGRVLGSLFFNIWINNIVYFYLFKSKNKYIV